jgi:alpha-L-fucosidase
MPRKCPSFTSASRCHGGRTDWFADAGYGLFVHWHANSEPAEGGRVPFSQAVERLDVEAFARQAEEAGAGYVIWTITHAINHLPFPSVLMDSLLPGRTCERDLMADLHAALAARGIRLMFYHAWQAHGDPEFGTVAGWQQDIQRWQGVMMDLAREIGQRYTDRLSGYWIDNCRPDKWDGWMADYDFAAMAEALRTGGPRRILAFNISGPFPPLRFDERLSGIADYTAGHLHEDLLVAEASHYAGLRSHYCNNMDTKPKWFYNGENRKLRYSDAEVAGCIRANRAVGGVFSYGVAPAQEGAIDDATMAQLRHVRDRGLGCERSIER